MADDLATANKDGAEGECEGATHGFAAGKWEAEDVDGAGAEPLSDGGDFFVLHHDYFSISDVGLGRVGTLLT